MKEGFVLTAREKFYYGIGDFAANIAYTTIGFYIIFFLVNVAGLPAEIAGIIFLIARAWDAITDYLMGIISDRTNTRFGRRRPYLLFGSIPFGVAFFLLWIVPFESQFHLIIYYICITILFNTAFTVVSIPYNALLPELSQNYDERTSISGYRMGMSFVGNLVAAAGVAVIVDAIYPGRSHYRESYPVMAMIFSAIIIISVLVTFFGTKERFQPEEAHPRDILDTLKSILGLREFRIVLGMFLFNMIGFDLIQALFIFFLKDVIHVSEDMTFVIMGIPLVVAVLAAPLWVRIGERLGKRRAYISAALYFIVSLATCMFIPAGSIIPVIVIAVLAGIGISATQIIPFSIIPDVIEIDEYESGTRREGAFYGITMFLYKVASAVAISMASGLLGFFGYMENSTDPQPHSAILCIRLLMGVGPGIFFLISAYFVKILPITKERFDEVKRAIESRKRDSTE
jgi:GPH family glycoside/pentoside/hexuronide:cation symporter